MKMGRILCLCTFPLLYTCLTVFCPIYLTSHALCGLSWKKGFWKLKETFLQRVQPNLWTVLIANCFLERVFCLTLPNEMPKEILRPLAVLYFYIIVLCFKVLYAHF